MRESTAIGRELGGILRRYREKAGLTLGQLGERLGRSVTFLHRLEMGQRQTSETDVVHFMAACGASYQEVDQVLRLCRQVSDDCGYWMLITSGIWMSDVLQALVFHEARATHKVGYEPEVIPGLLQTQPYVEALFRRWDVGPATHASRVQVRLDRQRAVFRNKRAKFTHYIHERALRIGVGDYRVMAEQMLAMLFFADQWNISIRVVPLVARHRGVFGGPFCLMNRTDHAPMVYLEQAVGGTFIEDGHYVRGYRDVAREIDSVALDEVESRALIARLADEYDRIEGSWASHTMV